MSSLRRVTVALLAATACALSLLVVSAPAEAATAPAAKRIVAVAKKLVGHARYAEGGNSPRRGFDCSGFTQYVYAKAKAGKLPHNAEAQRRMKHMKRVSARKARPGDLVFYSKPAFHVAIYAGHHKQYAAATPRDGIRYQRIWSSDVTYGRLTK